MQVAPSQARSMGDVLNELRNHYSVDLLYSEKLVQGYTVPEGIVNYSKGIEYNLKVVLSLTDLEFKKVKKNAYVVAKSGKAASGEAGASNTGPTAQGGSTTAAVPSAAPAEGVVVSGRVLDAGGQPIPGVTVLVKGTSIVTLTAADGAYSIEVPVGSILVFRSVGFVTQEVSIAGATSSLAITLAENVVGMGEVVVVGYGTQRRQDLTNSVSSVKGEELARQPVAGFDQALQGQAAGVQVTAPTGQPGAGINVRIRGNNSFSLTNSPLYVIDGVPVLPTYDRELSIGNQKPNPLNSINPNDIETIDVLKDGAAAAIYGLRASNGVVVITTKRGKAGRPQVSFNYYVGVQQLRKKISMLNARQFAHYFNQAQTAAGFDTTNAGQGFPDLNRLPSGVDSVPYNTDWQDQVYKTGLMRNYQISASGGNENTHYYISGGYYDQTGILRNSGFDRYNAKLNLDQKMTKSFKVGVSLNLSRTNTNGSARSELGAANSGTILGALAQIPTIPVYLKDGATYAVNPFARNFDNPVGNLKETSNKALTYQVIGNAYGELELLPNLKLRSSLGIDYRNQLENQFITRNYPGTTNSAESLKGSGATGTTLQTIWLMENTVTYTPNLGEGHSLTLLGGQSVQESDRFTSGASGTGYASSAVPYISAATANFSIYSYEEQWGLVSYFARANYAYQDRYLLSLSVRADGTSRFAQHFGYFPALGLGWRPSMESFWPKNSILTDLKVRGSVGANGNQEIYVYDRFSTYSAGYNYQGAGTLVGGIGPDRVGNPNVSWETTYQYDAGMDFGFLEDSRLTLNVDVYSKNTMKLLTTVPLAPSTGSQSNSVIQNLGQVNNRGLEIGIAGGLVTSQTRGFTWNTNFNVSFNRNKVVDLGKLTNDSGKVEDRRIVGDYSITQAGSPLGSFYGYVVDKVFQTYDEVANAPYQANAQPGDLKFKDLNGDGVIDSKDRKVIGNPNPKATLGFTNTFGWKGIELSVLFQSSLGNDIYNQNRTLIEGMASAVNQTSAVLDRWTPGNPNTQMPRAVTGDPNLNNRFSTRFVEDGSYVRLKNITLGYSFPSSAIKFLRMSQLRIYATAQNLVTWTHYSGYDPEVSADPFSSTGFGRDLGVYPQSRTYIFGANVTF